VNATGRIRKHLQTIILWSGEVFRDLEASVVLPVGLPFGFDTSMIVGACCHHNRSSLSSGVHPSFLKAPTGRLFMPNHVRSVKDPRAMMLCDNRNLSQTWRSDKKTRFFNHNDFSGFTGMKVEASGQLARRISNFWGQK